MSADADTPAFEAIIRPYRSLGPDGFRNLLRLVIAANVVFAIVILWLGGWPVLVFLGLDVLAVYVAFRVSYAQMRAFERVTINGEALTVERVDAKGQRREWRFPSYWVSVFVERGEGEADRVTLRSHGRSLEIGQYLSPFERADFADALRRALSELRAAPTQT
jgi:uncharacterized membrane protein